MQLMVDSMQWHTVTVYVLYLVNNKFSEMGFNADWWTFSLANRAVYYQLYIALWHFLMHMIISSVGVH